MDKFEKIKAEIERQKAQWRLGRSSEAKYRSEMLEDISSFIDSLEEEPVSEDTHVKNSKKNQHDSETSKENGDSLTCEDLEEAAEAHALKCHTKKASAGTLAASIYDFRAGAQWKENNMIKGLWHKGTEPPNNKHPYPVINTDTMEMAFAYYHNGWQFDRDYNPGRNMLWLDIEKILPKE